GLAGPENTPATPYPSCPRHRPGRRARGGAAGHRRKVRPPCARLLSHLLFPYYCTKEDDRHGFLFVFFIYAVGVGGAWELIGPAKPQPQSRCPSGTPILRGASPAACFGVQRFPIIVRRASGRTNVRGRNLCASAVLS